MINGLSRVSVAVKDIEDALVFYRDGLGLAVSAEMELPDRGLRLVRLRAAAGAEIELIQPTDPSGALATFIERRGEGLHHIALCVEDIELEMRALMARGVEMIDREAREGPGGRVAFVHPRATGGVLVELYEASSTVESGGQKGEERSQ